MTEKLERVPPEWAKLQRRSQGALLLAEAAALALITRAATNVHAHAVAHMTGAHAALHAITGNPRRAALMAVHSNRARMSHAVGSAVTEARANARLAAADRIDAELMVIETGLAKRGIVVQPLDVDADEADEDEPIGAMLGDSFASAWAAAMLLLVIRSGRTAQTDANASNASLVGLVRESNTVMKQLEYRLRRIATTESSRAYSAERTSRITRLAEEHKNAPWIAGLFRCWDATLDRRTCKTCRDHDGDLVHADESFAHGDQPGEVHAMCRCIDSTIFIFERAANTNQANDNEAA